MESRAKYFSTICIRYVFEIFASLSDEHTKEEKKNPFDCFLFPLRWFQISAVQLNNIHWTSTMDKAPSCACWEYKNESDLCLQRYYDLVGGRIHAQIAKIQSK